MLKWFRQFISRKRPRAFELEVVRKFGELSDPQGSRLVNEQLQKMSRVEVDPSGRELLFRYDSMDSKSLFPLPSDSSFKCLSVEATDSLGSFRAILGVTGGVVFSLMLERPRDSIAEDARLTASSLLQNPFKYEEKWQVIEDPTRQTIFAEILGTREVTLQNLCVETRKTPAEFKDNALVNRNERVFSDGTQIFGSDIGELVPTNYGVAIKLAENQYGVLGYLLWDASPQHVICLFDSEIETLCNEDFTVALKEFVTATTFR